ncbi:MAG TPA: T9SS type A sorting domain-containing protein, partial [Saprospiraceae bacterium]|nr:T9SS type A sorting domain-containing protein [Saprospiraceae bacterium]
TCISADRVEGDPATINVTASLTGNEFDGDGFLAPYKGANLGRPHHAIIANYVNQFSIGAAGTNIPKNVFKRFQPTASGLQIIPVVASFNTNLTVRNSTFEDIGDFSSIAFETPNIGIWASSDNSKTFTLDVKGIFKFGEPTFKNVYKGIECYGTCLKVDQCTFDNGINHILVQPANTPISPQVSPALSYSITNSTFGRFIQAAISAQGVFPAQKFVVSNNTFIDNTSISPGGSTAAEFLSKSPLTSHLSIKENTVTKTSDVFASGFVLEGVAEAFVGNNTFTNLSSTSSVALIFNSAHRGIAKENSFSGINDIGDTESGLKVFNSFGTKALCNDFDQLGQGMRFEGNGCDGSILFNNKFGSHNFAGIYLPDFTTIGQQPAYANEWPNTSTTDEARFELDPLDPNWNDKLDASKFIIPIPEAVNPDLWAQPRYPEGNAWFIYENIVQSELCSVYGEAPSDDDMGLTATDAMVLSGTHPNYGGYPATTWDAQLRLYGRLHIRPDLRPASSSADSFYTSNQNAPFARLAVALEQYRQAIAPDATLNQQLGAYYAQVDSLNLLIADADSVIAAGGSISATLWQMRSAHVQALDLVSQLATAALNAFATSRNATLSTLQTTVNSIGTAQTWETNLKSALGILLTGPQASPAWTWTSMQNSTLESIAAQCAHEGGYGVILARLMLGDNAPNDDNCFNQQRTASRSGSVGKSLLRVYPNPTTGLLHILDAGEGRLLVRDQTGRTVLEQLASGSPLTVDLSTLPQGLYFLQVVSGAQSSATHKVFLNR